MVKRIFVYILCNFCLAQKCWLLQGFYIFCTAFCQDRVDPIYCKNGQRQFLTANSWVILCCVLRERYAKIFLYYWVSRQSRRPHKCPPQGEANMELGVTYEAILSTVKVFFLHIRNNRKFLGLPLRLLEDDQGRASKCQITSASPAGKLVAAKNGSIGATNT